MGLMVNYQIKANGNDITHLIRDRLLQLVIRDVHGELSDTLEIELDNRDLKIQPPSTGAELSVYIGYGDQLINKGVFQVDELSEPLEVDTITIHAKAARMKQSYKAPRDRTYDNITIGALVEQVAARHGFLPAVSPDLASIHYEHLSQHGESDMNMLSRLAREHNALTKPVANRLLFVPKDQARSASGQAIPPIQISDPTQSRGNVTSTERNNYLSVVAYWYDEDKAERVKVTSGTGEPVFTIRYRYPSADKAQGAADAKLRALQRGLKTMRLNRPLMPEAMAEVAVIVSGHKASANGDWVAEEVTHTIAGGQFATSDFVLHLPKK